MTKILFLSNLIVNEEYGYETLEEHYEVREFYINNKDYQTYLQELEEYCEKNELALIKNREALMKDYSFLNNQKSAYIFMLNNDKLDVYELQNTDEFYLDQKIDLWWFFDKTDKFDVKQTLYYKLFDDKFEKDIFKNYLSFNYTNTKEITDDLEI